VGRVGEQHSHWRAVPDLWSSDEVELWKIAIVALAGGACGLFNSIAGGGSLVLFPTLLLVGLPPLSANVTNSVATWPGYVGGVGGFRAEIVDQRPRLPRLLVATVLGSLTGCVLLLVTPSAAFTTIVPQLMLVAAEPAPGGDRRVRCGRRRSVVRAARPARLTRSLGPSVLRSFGPSVAQPAQ